MSPDKMALPSEFDSRRQWPGCISVPMDQKKCDACWAYSTVLSLSDRLRIKYGRDGVSPLFVSNLSPQYMVANSMECTDDDQLICKMGCKGGYIDSSLRYLQINGVPTIADQAQETPLLYRSKGSKHLTLPVSGGGSPLLAFSSRRGGSQITIQNTKLMSHEIMRSGPIIAGFDMYQNFYDEEYNNYYTETKGRIVIKHAICITGWKLGSDGRSYWICRNSYGTNYMDNGYFYLPRGINFCNIESDAYAPIV